MSCKEIALDQIETAEVKINNLKVKQAAKWFLLHERRRHIDDINAIDDDLAKLDDITLPQELLRIAGFVRFRIVGE